MCIVCLMKHCFLLIIKTWLLLQIKNYQHLAWELLMNVTFKKSLQNVGTK